MGFLRIRNWDRYQHYADDKPVTWVKLHIKILDDALVRTLDESTQCHLFKLIALAGRRSNVLPADPVILGALIDAQSPLNIDALSHWLEESDGQPQIKSRRESRLPSKYSTSTNLKGKGKSTEEGKPADRDPLIGQKKQWAVDEWNKVASDRGWTKVSRIPTGANGDLLDARVRDDWWLANYPAALTIVWNLQWPDKPKKGKKGLKFSALLRGDAVRAIVDGEWDDATEDVREGGSRDIAEDEAEKILKEALK